MLELWNCGKLVGYFRAPKGYTSREWAQKYNANKTKMRVLVLW